MGTSVFHLHVELNTVCICVCIGLMEAHRVCTSVDGLKFKGYDCVRVKFTTVSCGLQKAGLQ